MTRDPVATAYGLACHVAFRAARRCTVGFKEHSSLHDRARAAWHVAEGILADEPLGEVARY